MTDFCRHYPSGGMAHNTVCLARVRMDTVRESEPPYYAPCYTPELSHLCNKHEPYTAEEIAQQEAETAAAIAQINAFWAHESEVCPMCGEHVAALEQVERCVYSRPCGCRQFQGTVPDAWK